jgi:hypothetical protein
MRIDTPSWVVVDHTIYQSLSLNLNTQSGVTATMGVFEIGRHPELLARLEREMTAHSGWGDWAARLWAVSPSPRFDPEGQFILGWVDTDPDVRLDQLLDEWALRLGHPVSTIQLTWTCLPAPRVDALVDLRAAAEPPSSDGVTAHIRGRALTVRHYQRGAEPPIRGAYDPETRTLFQLL